MRRRGSRNRQVPDWVLDLEHGWQDWCRTNGHSVVDVIIAARDRRHARLGIRPEIQPSEYHAL